MPDISTGVSFSDPKSSKLVMTGPIYRNAADSYTANAGGGQTNAVALAADVVRISTVASRSDSVMLPTANAGRVVVVVNDGAAPMAVYPATGDQINGGGANNSILQMAQSVDVYACVVAGKWHVEAGAGYSGSLMCELAQDGLTAHAGGGQGSALALTSQMNRITTVATAGDSVALPASAAGLEITVINHGANAVQVFGAGSDTINDVAAATGVSQMPSSTVLYFCAASGAWYTECLATGFSGNFATQSYAGGITAHAGGGQGSAVALTSMVNRVTTVASANDSVVLPASVANISIGPITVANAAGVNSLAVFPAAGDQINALGANIAFAVAAGKTANFYSTGAGQWHAVLSA